jgi:hypothetical protein
MATPRQYLDVLGQRLLPLLHTAGWHLNHMALSAADSLHYIALVLAKAVINDAGL